MIDPSHALSRSNSAVKSSKTTPLSPSLAHSEVPTPKSAEKQKISEETKSGSKNVAVKFAGSHLFRDVNYAIDSYPKFSLNELDKGELLGKGRFGVVSEITGVRLPEQGHKISTTGVGKDTEELIRQDEVRYFERRKANPDFDNYECKNREFIAKHCIRLGGNARYAFKTLSEEVKSDPKLSRQAAMDLAVETYFLATIEHPNIVKMRGLAMGDMCGGSYFIVLDRLYDTLAQRLLRWRKMEGRRRSMRGKMMDPMGTKKEKLFEERISVAFDLAAAMEYLHSLNIMHRDIKPENIGFDVRGDVKVFDFGLAKELRPKDKTSNGLYLLTGSCGSWRYMAPEVFKKEPYNNRADVYSFAILLWEMLHLVRPFAGYGATMFAVEVFERGGRPILYPNISSRLQILLRRGWAQSIDERLRAADVKEILKQELLSIRKEKDSTCLDNVHLQRKSTFIAPRRQAMPIMRRASA